VSPEDLIPQEEWAFIPNTNHRYAISTWAAIVKVPPSHPLDKLDILPPLTPYHDLSNRALYFKKAKTKTHPSITRTVASIMGEVFLSSRPSPLHKVCHRDGDYTNNFITNLYWAVPGRFNAKLSPAQAHIIREERATGASIRTLANRFGVCCAVIDRILTHPEYAIP